MNARHILPIIAATLFFAALPIGNPADAISGDLSVKTSSSTSSGELILGNGKSLRSAFGPLTLDFKSDLDSWLPGIVIREVTGNVGIGTTAPTSRLKVNGNIEGASLIDTANPSYYLDPANNTESLVVAGNVGIGKTGPTAKLDVAGGVNLGDNTGTIVLDGTNVDITSAGAVTLTGNLTLSSDTNEGITGGGLTDCTTSTSKLLWSASSNQFSCGTDNSGINTLVEKNADQVVNNSSTLQDDTDLNFTMAANTAYAVEASIRYTSTSAAPDFKYAFTIPAGATMNLLGQGFTNTTTISNCRINASGTACTLTGAVAPDWTISIIGIVQTAGTAGDFQFQWAQNSANANDTIVKKNSWMKIATMTGAADLAEIYETDDPTIEPGHMVSIGPRGKTWITKSTIAYDPKVIGVVSTKPAYVMGSAPDGGLPVLVALTGRVPVQIDPTSLPIVPGDFLTSSSTPGLAIKATSAGYAIAKALGSWKPGAREKTIDAFLSAGFIDPDLSLTTTGDISIANDATQGNYVVKRSSGSVVTRIGSFAELVSGTLRTGLLKTNKLMLGATDIGQALDEQRSAITKLQEEVTAQRHTIQAQQQIIGQLEERLGTSPR